MPTKPTAKSGFKNAAEAAIDDLFSDNSVPLERTLEMLQDLRSNLDFKIGSIQEDLKRGTK